MSFSFAALTDNLVSYYKFDYLNGNAIDYFSTKDLVENGTILGDLGVIGDSRGIFSSSNYFSNNSILSMTQNVNYSFSFWIKRNKESNNQIIFYTGRTATNDYSFYIYYDNNKLRFKIDKHNINTFYNQITTDDIPLNEWVHVVFTYNGGTRQGIVYINGSEDKTAVASSTTGYNTKANFVLGKGNIDYIDELGVWNKVLTSNEVIDLYNSGNAYSYPFDINAIFANFNYNINIFDINLIDVSTSTGETIINDWNWLINDLSVSNNQSYFFTGTEHTDYNICLIIKDTINNSNDSYCQNVNIPDLTPPTTTFTSNQVSGTTDQNITLTCTDNNSGCEYINFSINNGDWNYYLIGNNPLSIIFSDTGDNNIRYYSSDYNDNNESINIDSFSTYGAGTINIYDENSESLLNDVTYTISPSINGNSGATLTDTNTFDLNLQGITNTTYTFTFTKTDYGTRYYITDLNQYSELDINFALLPSTLSTSIPLKVYQTDETTLFTNTFVELYLPSKNDWIVGRQKTDSIGETTFSLHLEDQNYNANIAGIYTYQPVALTILYPKNEITLNQIDENWQIDITQNLYQSFTELNSDKIIYLLPNTANPFNIKISDMNGNYFSRTYAQQYPGNPLTDTLQPYLMPTDEGLLTTITTYNRNNITQSDVTIKIYKYISGLGRTLVEQVITDSKGQALVLLEINDDYEFETYYNGSFIKTYNITATSSNIYIVVDIPEDITTQTPNYFKTVFTPYNTGLIKANSGTQDFGFIVSNPGESSVNIYAIILQNGINLGDLNDTLTTTTDTFEITINWTDLNIGEAEARIFIITDSNTYVFRQYYQINDSFGTNYDILAGFQTYIRTDFGCEATGVCYPLLAMGILFSIVIVLFASVKVTGIGSNSSGIMFGILMIFFSYLNWIPVEITLGIVLIIAAFIINERRS